MPIYEYACASCGNQFEMMRPMSQSGDPASCPNCDSPADKQMSIFGSKTGFYLKTPEKEAFRPEVKKTAKPKARTATKAKPKAKAAAKPASRPKAKAK